MTFTIYLKSSIPYLKKLFFFKPPSSRYSGFIKAPTLDTLKSIMHFIDVRQYGLGAEIA